MSPLLEPEVLATLLTDPWLVVLDARFSLGDPKHSHKLYLQGHIPGARYIDLEEDLSGVMVSDQTGRHPLPEPELFARVLGRLGINENSHVVIYDDGGHAMAARAWWQLRWVGVEKVQVLHGGLKSWLGGRYPTTRSLPDVKPVTFEPRTHPQMTVSAEDILMHLTEPQYLLMDARAPERFAGMVEPLDPKAGHIPGAVCVPFQGNMDDGGLFLSKDELKGRFAKVLRSDRIPVVYCGSGVTACHNLLAMEYAGISGVKLYPGSWSEWITQEHHPIETGE